MLDEHNPLIHINASAYWPQFNGCRVCHRRARSSLLAPIKRRSDRPSNRARITGESTARKIDD
jgi:hypothetical protein